MTISARERQSVGQIALCGIVFLCTAIPVGLLLRVGWRDWPLFAGLWAIMYFMGGIAWFPRGTPVQKAFSYGLLVGTVLSALEWASTLNR
ncbi:hypothetical protein [Bradyrhizobium sp. OK095]|jgi:hypothetical protein|uniref:hypothetical protein n=1 Tax=Bradyrhizobium sp. OK095 TaxID=1882760 RepID=UPI0008AA9E0A|nr:hypothetical protein [Bradyrhizobium sp. OK095]SEM20521.1 hypothetical protein SAMN05443254_101128 [Bradyrhizobium sp. OK095]